METNQMSKERLHEIQVRVDAATEGPWEYSITAGEFWSNNDTVVRDGDGYGIGVSDQDAAFIAHSRTDIPDLLAEIDRQAAEIERMRNEQKTLRNELCFKCGAYREEHKGACDGCRWRKERI